MQIWYFLIGIRFKRLYTSPHDKNKQYIFVANHWSYQDAPTLLLAVRQKLRALGKIEMSKVPVFGLLYRNAAIMVDRSSAESRKKSVLHLKKAIAEGNSIFIFPEGTFNETKQPLKSFFDGAFRIAIETQTNIRPIIFPDTKKRMPSQSLFFMTPGINRAIYLEEINVQGLTPEDLPILKGKVYKAMENALIQYP